MKTSPTEVIRLIGELAEAYEATLSGPEQEQDELARRVREFVSDVKVCTNCEKPSVSWKDQCNCDSDDDDRDTETR